MIMVNMEDYMQAYIREHVAGSVWRIKPVVLDKNGEIITTPEGQPVSYIVEELLRFGKYRIVKGHCLPAIIDGERFKEREVVFELYTKKFIDNEEKRKKFTFKEGRQWEQMKH